MNGEYQTPPPPRPSLISDSWNFEKSDQTNYLQPRSDHPCASVKEVNKQTDMIGRFKKRTKCTQMTSYFSSVDHCV